MSKGEALRLYFANPAVAFVSAWLLVLGLCALRWAPAFDPLYSESMRLAVIIITAYLVGYIGLGVSFMERKGPISPQPAADFVPNNWLRVIFIGWAAVSAYEIYQSGGLPILWLSDGSGRTYDMFGVRGLHGFMNALWMFLSFTYLVNLIRKPSFEKAIVFALLVLWVFLVISRALLLLAFVQTAAYVLAANNLKFRYAIPATVAGLVIVALAFGALGDARQPKYNIYSSVGVEPSTVTTSAGEGGVTVPAPTFGGGAAMSTMTWGYAYLVSPVATLALNVEETPPEYNFVPYRALSLFLPTLAKRALGMGETFEGDFGVLAHGAFNVSTAFREFYADWGLAGIVIFAAALGLASNLVWRMREDPENLPLICAFSMCAAYTVFNNQFFQPMILTYIALLIFIPRLAAVRAGRHQLSPS